MPHFFLPINWLFVPLVIMMALLVTTAIIYWAIPNLKFPSIPTSTPQFSSTWELISESYSLVY